MKVSQWSLVGHLLSKSMTENCNSNPSVNTTNSKVGSPALGQLAPLTSVRLEELALRCVGRLALRCVGRYGSCGVRAMEFDGTRRGLATCSETSRSSRCCEALSSPWALHQWLQGELLHWQAPSPKDQGTCRVISFLDDVL